MRTLSPTADVDGELRQRPTMRDVAALAGVALKTVSRVMNDVPTVDPELAKRVRDAAAKLGYRPNVAAGNLRRSGGRTGTIGLLLVDVGNPFSAAIHRAVEAVARDRGVLILTGSLNEDAAWEMQLARALIDRRTDGLIIVPAGDDYRWMGNELASGTAFTFVDRAPNPLMADTVVADSRAGAELATRHLIAGGHRRVAFLGDDLSIQTARERLQGYRDALSAAGLDDDSALVRSGLRTTESAREAALELLDTSAPTAIFAGQNLISIGVIGALHARDLEHSIAMVGFDDLAMAEALDPAITVVDQDAAAMGRVAAERLFARLDGDTSPPAVYTLPTRLIVRGSGEIAPLRSVGSAAVTS